MANGIEIFKANDVWVENHKVRNFEFGSSCPDEECGNDIWWKGGTESKKIGAHGWYAAKIQGTWGCQNKTTPTPGGGEAGAGYILGLIEEEALLRKPEGQPAPPPQQTMPNPCEGVPKNPL